MAPDPEPALAGRRSCERRALPGLRRHPAAPGHPRRCRALRRLAGRADTEPAGARADNHHEPDPLRPPRRLPARSPTWAPSRPKGRGTMKRYLGSPTADGVRVTIIDDGHPRHLDLPTQA